jgi:sugar lactone lactonase YvrE
LTSTGLFLDVFPTGLGAGLNNPNTGVCFSPDGKVLATRFGQNTAGARLFSRHGAVQVSDFGATPGLFFNSHESCVYDAAGNVYIGQAGISGSSDASVPVLKFGPTGILLDSFVLPTGTRGTDWIELSSNQCTLYYTSEDTTVRRYNLCTRTPLADLTSVLTGPCYALRLRPNSELMVACQDNVYRVSAQGSILRTYTRQSIGETNAQGLFALNLDPDGTSFWTAGALSGMVYRVDIASGAVLTAFASGASGGASGLAVYDELSETDVLLADGFESTTAAPKSAPAPRDPASAPTGPELPHYLPLGLTSPLVDD